VETPEGVRTLRQTRAEGAGPYTVVEDTGVAGTGATGGARRWRTETAGGPLDAALLADRPVEERLRPVWSLTWAVPVDAEGAPARPDTAPVVHAPTPTDEPLGVPALLIASFPLEPTRRHTAPGPLTDFLVERAAEAYAALLRDWHPVGVGTIGLVPGPLGKGELDGELRRRILELLPRVPFLPSAAAPVGGETDGGTETGWPGSPDALGPDAARGGPENPGGGATAAERWDDEILGDVLVGGSESEPYALRPRDAEILEGVGAETVQVLAELFPTLLPAGLERRQELRVLGVARVPLGEVIDRLAGVERAPAWWRRLYDSLGGTDPDRLTGLPVPLADGRTTIGPRQVLLPLPGETGGEQAGAEGGEARGDDRHRTLARLGLKVAHPDAAHPLLEKLGATPATPRAVLTTPQ
ncbi:molecular chaperone Hsp90, partial [Streptomyces sp. MCAF7]